MHPSKIIIDTAQLVNNIQTIKHKIGNNCKFCLPVKANAYGHGLIKTAKIAEEHVDYLAVACLNEGVTLRNNGIKKPILVFGAFDDEQIAELIANDLQITITSLQKAQTLARYCMSSDLICKVHLKIDTGMHRVGVAHHEAKEFIDYVLANPVLQLVGIYSHLAASDSPDRTITERQIELFAPIASYAKACKPEVICHLANSGAVTYYPESYFDMVRPGIISYGYPIHPETALSKLDVKPCLTLVSHIMHMKKLPPNNGISYGHRYTTHSDENIATIAIGYGDGWRRSLSNKGQCIIINNKKYPIVGNICMDMCMINLGQDQACVGDEVILIGHSNNQSITVREISNKLDTIDYEIITAFTERLPRIYL